MNMDKKRNNLNFLQLLSISLFSMLVILCGKYLFYLPEYQFFTANPNYKIYGGCSISKEFSLDNAADSRLLVDSYRIVLGNELPLFFPKQSCIGRYENDTNYYVVMNGYRLLHTRRQVDPFIMNDTSYPYEIIVLPYADKAPCFIYSPLSGTEWSTSCKFVVHDFHLPPPLK